MGLFSWVGGLFSKKEEKPALTINDRFDAIRKMLPEVGIPQFQATLNQETGMFQFWVSITDEATKEQVNLGFMLSIHAGSMHLRCYGACKLPAGASPLPLLREINRINRDSLLKLFWNEQDGDVEIEVDLLLAGGLPTVGQLGMALAGPFAILQRERASLLRACGIAPGGTATGGAGGQVDAL